MYVACRRILPCVVAQLRLIFAEGAMHGKVSSSEQKLNVAMSIDWECACGLHMTDEIVTNGSL